ncbi:MAG: sulfatase-like hydrolase/transferase [Parvularculales bacterium]
MKKIMTPTISKWLKRLALVLAVPVAGAVLLVAYVTFKIATYEQADDAARLQSKQVYLSGLPQSVGQHSPDIVIILFDDLGFGDVGFTGNTSIKTPHIDELAANGVVLTNYFAPAPVCSPSRAAMLTGRMAPRNGLTAVPFPSGTPIDLLNRFFDNPVRLPREEIIIADVLKASGFHTAMVGKWHMGDHDQSIPTEFGFDIFFGTYHSNDMNPFHLVEGAAGDGEKIAYADPVDQTTLNGLYAEKAEQFIAGAPQDKPMFLYFAHNFPHVPLYTAPHEHGRSDAGLYGDVVQGLDDTVGRIVAALKKRGTFDNTLIIITSDNGPWWEGRGTGRGRKGETFEGGVHVPFVAHWPAQLQPRVSGEPVMGSDLLPTLLDELKIAAPADRKLDGLSISQTLRGGKTPHDALYYYGAGTLMAVRQGRYKYRDRKPIVYATDPVFIPVWSDHGPFLFDMETDPDESYDVSTHRPDVAARLKEILDARNAEMAANPRGWK